MRAMSKHHFHSMFSSFMAPLTALRPCSQDWTQRSIAVPPVEAHGIESAPNKRAQTLKQLLKANHENHSTLYGWHSMFHNHSPHILGSAYVLGATPEQLNTIYNQETRGLSPWKSSPGEISKDDWRDYLGNKKYQRAYIDFFEDQLVERGYDWKALLRDFLFSGKEPLISTGVSSLGHPLIHLAYAYELESVSVATEALALATCVYDDMHKYLDDPSWTKPSKFSSKSTLELVEQMATDKRLNERGWKSLEDKLTVPKRHESVLMEYWNGWDVHADPKAHFEESQRAAAALAVATRGKGSYNFYLVHLLTASHAVRILLPIVPSEFQLPLVRQWWLFALVVYNGQDRPGIEMKRIEDYPLNGATWSDATQLALTGKHAHDAHYVKGIRALKSAAETWGDESGFFLKAAMKFAREFNGWGY